MVFLTTDELDSLRRIQGDLTKAKIALGEMELEKQDLLRQVSMLRQRLSEDERILIGKYGQDAIINMSTGEVTQKNK